MARRTAASLPARNHRAALLSLLLLWLPTGFASEPSQPVKEGTGVKQAETEWKIKGPAGAIWIPLLSTRDDSKKLCLNSGVIIRLAESSTRTFPSEVEVVVASPTAISRCGMIYGEPMCLLPEKAAETPLITFNVMQAGQHVERARLGGGRARHHSLENGVFWRPAALAALLAVEPPDRSQWHDHAATRPAHCRPSSTLRRCTRRPSRTRRS